MDLSTYLSPSSLPLRFSDALSYAAALHAEQRRKVSGEPYVAHLLAVTAIVMEYGGDEDEAIAALLHDAVEDQGGMATREEIRRRFGEKVVEIVDGCTDTAETPKPPWRSARRHSSRDWPLLRPRCGWSWRPTSCTTPGRFSANIAGWANRCGAISAAAAKGRFGTYLAVVDTLGRAERTPLVEDLEEAVGRMERLA